VVHARKRPHGIYVEDDVGASVRSRIFARDLGLRIDEEAPGVAAISR